MRYGYVATNLLDLWAEPRFNSERSSQLLFCELLTIHDEQQGYFEIKQVDGYTGWADVRQIVLVDDSAYHAHLSAKLSVVKSTQITILSKRHEGVSPHHLYYGTLVRVKRQSKGFAEISLPDG